MYTIVGFHLTSLKFKLKNYRSYGLSHRNLAIAGFLVTAVRKNIGGLLSWLVSFSSSVLELTRHGLGRGFHVNP